MRRASVMSVLRCAVALTACGSSAKTSNSSSAPTTGVSTGTNDASSPRWTGDPNALEEYCTRYRTYVRILSNVDASSVKSYMTDLYLAARAAQLTADAAPQPIHSAMAELARSGNELVKAIDARKPQSLDQLDTAAREVTKTVQAKYPGLQRDTVAVNDFAHVNCGTPLP